MYMKAIYDNILLNNLHKENAKVRKLTIKRTKSFVACLSKLQVYVEDPTSNEILINNIACRRLGDLKNGEKKTFYIDESAVKVFVIADKLSRNYCNEYYQIPEGDEDVFLSGKNYYNPFNGNAFRFDNNDSEDVVANRKRNTRKMSVVFILSIIVGIIIGYFLTTELIFNKNASPKTFSDSGMSITLTKEFEEFDVDNFTVSYASKDVAVFALKEDFSLVPGLENYDLMDYVNAVLRVNNLSDDNVKTIAEYVCIVYDRANDDTNEEYRYFVFAYKADDAFWLVQFAVQSENADRYEDQIAEWAGSMKFSK